MADRRKVLDLYCCQGGATRGYQASGLFVAGVDIDMQRHYCGDAFYRSDAVEFARKYLKWIQATFCFIHASPPCQLYSATQRINGNSHPDLIGPTREALELTGLPYVIENVEDARSELIDPVTLCGAMFGLHTYRHRLFEIKGFELRMPAHPVHKSVTVKMGRALREGDFYHAVGNFSNVPYVREDMGMEWATREGIREAIPPAYTQYIANEFMGVTSTPEEIRNGYRNGS